jgi:hypothetical protein
MPEPEKPLEQLRGFSLDGTFGRTDVPTFHTSKRPHIFLSLPPFLIDQPQSHGPKMWNRRVTECRKINSL